MCWYAAADGSQDDDDDGSPIVVAIMLTSWLSLTLKEVGILHHGYDAVMVMHYILKQKKIKSTSFPTVLFILRYVQVLVSLRGGKHQVKGRS